MIEEHNAARKQVSQQGLERCITPGFAERWVQGVPSDLPRGIKTLTPPRPGASMRAKQRMCVSVCTWSNGSVHGLGLLFTEAQPAERCDGLKGVIWRTGALQR